jgi:hypothetical protein
MKHKRFSNRRSSRDREPVMTLSMGGGLFSSQGKRNPFMTLGSLKLPQQRWES